MGVMGYILIQLTKVLKHLLKIRWDTVEKRLMNMKVRIQISPELRERVGDKYYEKAIKRRTRMADFQRHVYMKSEFQKE